MKPPDGIASGQDLSTASGRTSQLLYRPEERCRLARPRAYQDLRADARERAALGKGWRASSDSGNSANGARRSLEENEAA